MLLLCQLINKLEDQGVKPSSIPQDEVLSLLRWLQCHVSFLAMEPGEVGDLFVNLAGDVFAAVQVKSLSMQSKPTLVNAAGRYGGRWPAM